MKGIEVITQKAKALVECPAIIMGAFNASETSQTYAYVTQNFFDVKYQVENDDVQCAAFQNWGGEGLDNPPIDYIMISQTGFEVNSYEVITKTYNGVYPSGHFPIVSKLTLTQ